MEQNTTSGTHISVVIPVYNEADRINETVRHVWKIAGGQPVEIIVVDGGPGHSTLKAITSPDVIKVESRPGRGIQMNVGAAVATGDILLFLHADTALPHNALNSIRRALAGRAQAGAFSLSIDSPRAALACVAFFANMRSRIERIPYGDQAQFIPTSLFRDMGGYAGIPIMEDVELFLRIRLEGLPIVILRDKVKTSPRRWESEGILRRTLKNWRLRFLYRFGASPESLHKDYRPHGTDADEANE